MKSGAMTGILLAMGALLVVVLLRRSSNAGGSRLDLNLGGPPGLAVTGTYTIDGATNPFAGTTPTNLVLLARDLSYVVQTSARIAGLRVTVYVDELPRTSVLAGTNGGVRGHYRIDSAGESYGATGY